MAAAAIGSASEAPRGLQPQWHSCLNEAVNALAWAPDGQSLAAGSAAGEVVLYDLKTGRSMLLQEQDDRAHRSVDALAWSADGQWLAAAGQSGQVKIWQRLAAFDPCDPSVPAMHCITTLDQENIWVDRLAWSPGANHLAYSRGKYVQIWDAETQTLLTTLNFEASTVLNLQWQPEGQRLAVSGYKGVKVWSAQDWDEDPDRIEVPSASVAIAWSPDGQYLAAGNLDRTLTVVAWGNPDPWVMRGFPSKIRRLAWADRPTETGGPLLAVASAEGVVLWEKQSDDDLGWAGHLLGQHDGIVQALAFQPDHMVLASASDDGSVVLWDRSGTVLQRLEGAPQGFSGLAWQPQGCYLAAAGQQGELWVWG